MLQTKRQLYQWDTNQTLVLIDPVGVEVTEVCFFHDRDEEALVVKPDRSVSPATVQIPNIILQQAGNFYARERVDDGDVSYTVGNKKIHVIPAARPADYVYTETATITYKKLEERVVALETDISNKVDKNGHSENIHPYTDAAKYGMSYVVSVYGTSMILLVVTPDTKSASISFPPETDSVHIAFKSATVKRTILFHGIDLGASHLVTIHHDRDKKQFAISLDYAAGSIVYNDTEASATVHMLATKDRVLTRTNTDEYTPTSDYHPATKKYVDDTISPTRLTVEDIESKYVRATDETETEEIVSSVDQIKQELIDKGNEVKESLNANAALKSILPLSEIVNYGAKYECKSEDGLTSEIVKLTADTNTIGSIFVTDEANSSVQLLFLDDNGTQDSWCLKTGGRAIITISNAESQLIASVLGYGSMVFQYGSDGNYICTQRKALVDQRSIPERVIEKSRLILDVVITARDNLLCTELDTSHFDLSQLCYNTDVYVDGERFKADNNYGYNGTYLSATDAQNEGIERNECVYMRYKSADGERIRVYFCFNSTVYIKGQEKITFESDVKYQISIRTTDELSTNIYPLYPASWLPDYRGDTTKLWEMREVIPNCAQVAEHMSDYMNSDVMPFFDAKQSVLTKGDIKKNSDGFYEVVPSKIISLGTIDEFTLALPSDWGESDACLFTFTCGDTTFPLNLRNNDLTAYFYTSKAMEISWHVSVSEFSSGVRYFVYISGVYGEVGELRTRRYDIAAAFRAKCKRPVTNAFSVYYTGSTVTVYEEARNAAIPVINNALASDAEVNRVSATAIAAANALKTRSELPTTDLLTASVKPYVLEAGNKGITYVYNSGLIQKTASGGEHGAKVTLTLNPDFFSQQDEYMPIKRFCFCRAGSSVTSGYGITATYKEEKSSYTFTFITGADYPANLANNIDVYVFYEKAALSNFGDSISQSNVKVISDLDVTYDTAIANENAAEAKN